MNKQNLFRWVVILALVGIAIFVTFYAFRSEASEGCQVVDKEGYWTYKTEKTYAKPVCPKWYHLQNDGNWNQLCHRDYHWMKPEHQAPTCPSGFSQDKNTCSKSEEVKDKWIETTYKTVECKGTCPTQCGYQGGEVADGKGGYTKCEATPACEVPVVKKKHNDKCDKPGKIGGFRYAAPRLFKWIRKDSVDKVDITAYSGDKTTVLWKMRTKDDGKEDLSGLPGTWFKIRGMNNCGLGDWSKKIDP